VGEVAYETMVFTPDHPNHIEADDFEQELLELVQYLSWILSTV
jgi:hypothetical protein